MSRRSILTRLSRLETASRNIACTQCSGAGRVYAVKAHLEPEPHEPEGCPGCGRVTVIRVTRVSRVVNDLSFRAQVRFE